MLWCFWWIYWCHNNWWNWYHNILGQADNGFTASTDDISNLSAGNYSLSVVDENDCPITLDVEITEPDPIEIVFTASNENGFGVLVMEIQMDL